MDEEGSPEQLLSYFKARQKEMPGKSIWEEGIRLTTCWIALLRNGTASQEAFDALMHEIEKVPRRAVGSGWFGLWLRVCHWGDEMGFSVPEDHPWRVPPNNFQCTNPEVFTEQLTHGKTYEAVARNVEKALIRIVDDRGKTRWYPASCFEEIQQPVRTYTQQNQVCNASHR